MMKKDLCSRKGTQVWSFQAQPEQFVDRPCLLTYAAHKNARRLLPLLLQRYYHRVFVGVKGNIQIFTLSLCQFGNFHLNERFFGLHRLQSHFQQLVQIPTQQLSTGSNHFS